MGTLSVDFSRFEVLTFDCYGTLVDWEAGILAVLRPVLEAHGLRASDEELLALYGKLEPAAQRGAYRPYREVLADVVRGFGKRLGFRPSPAEVRSLAGSVGEWPPFPDTVEALRHLGRRHRLAVISNIDRDLFQRTGARLGVEFHQVVTAEDARAYKPDPRPFRLALERLGVERRRVIHVAQSLFHDIVPAKGLGLAAVWVNRRAGKGGPGATPPVASGHRPDLEVPDLAALAGLLEPG